MTHRINYRNARPIACLATRRARAVVASITTRGTMIGTGTTGDGMWTRAAS